MDLSVSQDYTVAVIGFKPGWLFRLLGIPMEEIFDNGFDGFELLGSDVIDLIDRCTEEDSLEELKTKPLRFQTAIRFQRSTTTNMIYLIFL